MKPRRRGGHRGFGNGTITLGGQSRSSCRMKQQIPAVGSRFIIYKDRTRIAGACPDRYSPGRARLSASVLQQTCIDGSRRCWSSWHSSDASKRHMLPVRRTITENIRQGRWRRCRRNLTDRGNRPSLASAWKPETAPWPPAAFRRTSPKRQLSSAASNAAF